MTRQHEFSTDMPKVGDTAHDSARYRVRKHKASGGYVIWDGDKNALVKGSEPMRRSQAQGLADVLNREWKELQARANTVHDVESALDPVQSEIARRVSVGYASQAHDVAPALTDTKVGCASPNPDVAVEPAGTVAVADKACEPGCGCEAHDSGSEKAGRFVRKRMRAFARGTMKDAAGAVVDDRRQALAIALAEAKEKGLT